MPTGELNSTSKAGGASTGTEAGSPGSSAGATDSAGGSAIVEANYEMTTTR
jgi:hypothetical protein